MGLSKANLPRVKEQVDAINAQCVAHGIPTPTSFAYPGNTIDPDAIPTLAALGFRFARRGVAPEHATMKATVLPTSQAAIIRCSCRQPGDARPAWTLDNLKRAAVQATRGRIAIIQFHGTPDIQHPWVNTPRDRFEEYMKYLHDGGFRVIALRDLAKDRRSEAGSGGPVADHRATQKRTAEPGALSSLSWTAFLLRVPLRKTARSHISENRPIRRGWGTELSPRTFSTFDASSRRSGAKGSQREAPRFPDTGSPLSLPETPSPFWGPSDGVSSGRRH